MLKKAAQKGFTIVELLIVIVVIGILAALVLNTFAAAQKRARDTERRTDVNNIATQLEVYYGDNGGYPPLSEINVTTMKGLDGGALIAPNQSASSLVAAASANINQYGYQTLANDGSTACTATTSSLCPKFRLTWSKEDLKTGETNPQPKNSVN